MKKFSGSAISRHQVFALADGSFVVQWDDKRVQDILSGQYRDYEHRRDFGHVITDWELKQLTSAGRVEHYNQNYVWLYALPETGRFGHPKVIGRGDRIRAYYLSTGLPKSLLNNLQAVLSSLDPAEPLQIRLRNNIIVLLNAQGLPFKTLEEAEAAQHNLQARVPDAFGELTVAFLEIESKPHNRIEEKTVDVESLNLDELIASQRDTTITSGRKLVLAVSKVEERDVFTDLFEDMEMDVKIAETGQMAVELIEDYHPDLLVMDLQLPDMHGWQFLSKVKEIGLLRDLSVMIITDEPNITMTIARVEYITRPVSIARLRHNIWKILHERINSVRPSK